MYGLLLEAIVDYIIDNYGEENWEYIRRAANLQTTTFATHGIYSENIVMAIATATAELTGEDVDDLMDSFGVSFVSFVGQYGYDKVLKVLGRNMRDFLSGLDNLHEYLRFSYPKLQPPSFFVDNETQSGLTLHYRSRRKGFVKYVQGQIRQVGRLFYNTKITINVTSETTLGDLVHVVMRLSFDNTAYIKLFRSIDHITESLPLRSDVFFELFPFHIVFNRQLKIKSIGVSLMAVMPYIKGKSLQEIFSLIRPLVELTWESIMATTNNVFEIASEGCTLRRTDEKSKITPKGIKEQEAEHTLHLKGQMVFMPEWDCIIFMGTPVMENLEAMDRAGLYINDLSMHDSSRDLVLAGTQQSAELKLALDQEQQKSKTLEESMRKLDEEMKRTDLLLYQMIPKPVADRLRSGEESISTCEVFDCLTIVFSDVVGFTAICSQISPMDVVSMLNAMYTKFDNLSELHHVYKVETIGDAYMGVAGAPDVTEYHAASVCNMALDMLVTMEDLVNPISGESMKIRVGVHSGMAVAGVVGVKMPRYCLFGDTVNTASRMETNSEANKIHISETTKCEVDTMPYKIEERGSVEVKGKGHMKTYWLLGTTGEIIIPVSDTSSPDIGRAASLKSPTWNRATYSPVSVEDTNSFRSGRSTPCISPTPIRKLNKRQNDKATEDNKTSTVKHLAVKEAEKEPRKVDVNKTKTKQDIKAVPSSESENSKTELKETSIPAKETTTSKEISRKPSKVDIKKDQIKIPDTASHKNGSKDSTKTDEEVVPNGGQSSKAAQPAVRKTTDEKIDKKYPGPSPSVNPPVNSPQVRNVPPPRATKTPPSTPRKTIDLLAMEAKLKEDAESLANNGYVSLETSLHKVAQADSNQTPVVSTTPKEVTLSNNAPKYVDPEPVMAAIEQPKTRPLEQSQTCVLL
ncbi:soluble guanylate cyclase 88E-like [Mizuhopecten yessoensis]|uniref:guanylate cyclase n=1 Tax=Mizuhopecten yessoensis TaxID=6573 RepID=A0A210QWE2_MIZYE|nr:soluble guanylate cyclase 88E-like [Mizuhopecten yessoensis]OWF53088.1 Soluble guanylate cyclase 88E [Mizuhopecten yessoensis]